MSDLRWGLKSQNRKECTFRGFWSFVLHEISQVEETAAKEMENWKASPRDNMFLKISNSAPIQDEWSNYNRNYNLSMWPENCLTILCHLLASIPWLNVSKYVYGKKPVFKFLRESALLRPPSLGFKNINTEYQKPNLPWKKNSWNCNVRCETLKQIAWFRNFITADNFHGMFIIMVVSQYFFLLI